MKAVILCAGQGLRLLPLTKHRPKCMVHYKNRPLIDYILQAMADCRIQEIALVAGYQNAVLKEYLKDKNVRFYMNERFDQTNMVYSLFCAEEELNDDVIISYGDIYYGSEVLQALIDCKEGFAITVDKNWKALWEKRMADPLKDAETLKLDRRVSSRSWARSRKFTRTSRGNTWGSSRYRRTFFPASGKCIARWIKRNFMTERVSRICI